MSIRKEIIGAAWDISLNVRTDHTVHGMSMPCAAMEKKLSFVKSRLSPKDLEDIETIFDDCRRSLEAVVSDDYSLSTDLESPE